MSEIINKYKSMIRFLLDVINDEKKLDRINIGPPYPETRYLYATEKTNARRFFRLLDLQNFSYYMGRFDTLEKLIVKTNFKSETIDNLFNIHKPKDLEGIEVLRMLDNQTFEIINEIIPIWYLGILKIDQESPFKIKKFNPR